MKRIFLISLLFYCSSSGIFGHEEPAKTLKEKADKEKARMEILKNNILSYTVWKHKITDGKEDKILKDKFLTVIYDYRGNISEMFVFKNTDSLDYKTAFKYDENNNMTADTDYKPDGTISEKTEYHYDESGRVKEQINYLANGEIDSKFTYRTDYQTNTLVLTKYKPLDSIEYEIIYKYESSVDNGKNTEIIKQKSDGSLLLRAENIFNEQNYRTQKKIFDENNILLYYFEYIYYDNTDKFSSVTKHSPDNKILSKSLYTLNEMGFIESVKTIDEHGNTLSFSSYEYQAGK